MSSFLIPNAFWFRVSLACPRLDTLPLNARRGRLLDLPESCRLPDLPQLVGVQPWADIRTAWNPRGLAVQTIVSGKTGPVVRDADLADASEGLHLWIDTRDTRDVHRATRFCHRYSILLATSGRALGVDVELRRINRAAAHPNDVKDEAVQSRAERTTDGWLLELFFPAAALHGFEPETNRRLGFFYHIASPERGDQYLGVGRDFPIAEDPSLWATLELQDTPASTKVSGTVL